MLDNTLVYLYEGFQFDVIISLTTYKKEIHHEISRYLLWLQSTFIFKWDDYERFIFIHML